MRKSILHSVLILAAGALLAGCPGSIEDDLEMSGDELRKAADAMSEAELEAKIDELEKYSENLVKEVGDGEPSEAEMKRMTKAIEVAGIYATALAKKKMD